MRRRRTVGLNDMQVVERKRRLVGHHKASPATALVASTDSSTSPSKRGGLSARRSTDVKDKVASRDRDGGCNRLRTWILDVAVIARMHTRRTVHRLQCCVPTFEAKVGGEPLDDPVGVAEFDAYRRELHAGLDGRGDLAQHRIHKPTKALRSGSDGCRHGRMRRRIEMEQLMGANTERRASRRRWRFEQETIDKVIETTLHAGRAVNEFGREPSMRRSSPLSASIFGRTTLAYALVVDPDDRGDRQPPGIVGWIAHESNASSACQRAPLAHDAASIRGLPSA